MKMNPAFKNFGRATDNSVIFALLKQQERLLCGADETIIDLVIPRSFPRSDSSIAIQYRLTIENKRTRKARTLILFGLLNLNGRLDRADERTDDAELLYWPELDLQVRLFPSDPSLKALAHLVEDKFLLGYFAENAASLGFINREVVGVNFDVLGYRINRRAVLRFLVQLRRSDIGEIETATVIAKVVRPDKMKRTIEAQTSIRAQLAEVQNHSFSTPGIRFADTALGTYFMDEIKGTSLCDLPRDAYFITACNVSARLLKSLHQTPKAEWPSYTVAMELDELRKKLALLMSIYPELSSICARVLELLDQNWVDSPPDEYIATVHRDFYDKQLMVTSTGITLLDFDNLAAGDPAVDYGNFLAHIRLRQLQEPQNSAVLCEGASAFEQSYVNSDGSFDHRASWWEASALARLAMLYALRPRWNAISSPLLESALEVLNRMKTNKRKIYADGN